MAEIPLQQKERRNTLPLLLIAIAVVALLAWYFLRTRDADGTTANADTTRTSSTTTITGARSAHAEVAHVLRVAGSREIAA